MAFRVKTESFEGPFDLLLYLVGVNRVDIGSVSISQIADQYLAEVARMKAVDLDVASDFLVVAATLLQIKAESLLPGPHDDAIDDVEELAPGQAREILLERLLSYKQYKNVASMLAGRAEEEARCHARMAGPDKDLLGLMPDFLRGVSLDALAVLCAEQLGRRERFLLDSEHIAAAPIPVEVHVRAIHGRIRAERHVMFSDLVAQGATPALVVVTFLAVLELYKRNMIAVTQPTPFGDIQLDWREDAPELVLGDDDPMTSVEG